MKKLILAVTLAGLLISTSSWGAGYPNPHNPNIQTGGNGNGNNGCGNDNGGNAGESCGNNSGGGSGSGGIGASGGDGGAGGNASVGNLTTTISNSIGPIGSSLESNDTLSSSSSSSSALSLAAGGSVTESGNSTSSATGGAGGNVGLGDGALSSSNVNTANGGVANGGSATIADGAVRSSVSSQAASSGSAQASADGSGNSNTMVVVTGGDTVVKHRKFPVATAYAPPVSSGIDTCSGGFSAGAQTKVFGFSFGGTSRDRTCEVIKLSRELDNPGYGFEACQILVNEDPRVARAFAATMRTCMARVTYEDVVPLVPAPNPAVPPSYRAGERG